MNKSSLILRNGKLNPEELHSRPAKSKGLSLRSMDVESEANGITKVVSRRDLKCVLCKDGDIGS